MEGERRGREKREREEVKEMREAVRERERGKEVHVAIARAWEREKREVNLET